MCGQFVIPYYLYKSLDLYAFNRLATWAMRLNNLLWNPDQRHKQNSYAIVIVTICQLVLSKKWIYQNACPAHSRLSTLFKSPGQLFLLKSAALRFYYIIKGVGLSKLLIFSRQQRTKEENKGKRSSQTKFTLGCVKVSMKIASQHLKIRASFSSSTKMNSQLFLTDQLERKLSKKFGEVIKGGGMMQRFDLCPNSQ